MPSRPSPSPQPQPTQSVAATPGSAKAHWKHGGPDISRSFFQECPYLIIILMLILLIIGLHYTRMYVGYPSPVLQKCCFPLVA